jgi:hypothetical protein
MIRHYSPKYYAMVPLLGWGVAHGLIYLALSLAAQHHIALAATLLGLVVLARIAAAMTTNALFAQEKSVWRYAWLAPLHEVAGALLWFGAWLKNDIVWRGMRFRLQPTATAVRVDDGEEEKALP